MPEENYGTFRAAGHLQTRCRHGICSPLNKASANQYN